MRESRPPSIIAIFCIAEINFQYCFSNCRIWLGNIQEMIQNI